MITKPSDGRMMFQLDENTGSFAHVNKEKILEYKDIEDIQTRVRVFGIALDLEWGRKPNPSDPGDQGNKVYDAMITFAHWIRSRKTVIVGGKTPTNANLVAAIEMQVAQWREIQMHPEPDEEWQQTASLEKLIRKSMTPTGRRKIWEDEILTYGASKKRSNQGKDSNPTAPKKGSGKGSQGKCFNCNRKGHVASECWRPGKGIGKGTKRGSTSSQTQSAPQQTQSQPAQSTAPSAQNPAPGGYSHKASDGIQKLCIQWNLGGDSCKKSSGHPDKSDRGILYHRCNFVLPDRKVCEQNHTRVGNH